MPPGISTRFFIGYWIITGVDFYPAPFFKKKIKNNKIFSPMQRLYIDCGLYCQITLSKKDIKN